jgi:hypothetical protein
VLHKVFLKLRPVVVAQEKPKSSANAAPLAKQPALAPIVPVSAPTVIRDFFGRVVTIKEDTTTASAEPVPVASATTEKPMLRFKFNAGFTNAVRRTVYMKDFL